MQIHLIWMQLLIAYECITYTHKILTYSQWQNICPLNPMLGPTIFIYNDKYSFLGFLYYQDGRDNDLVYDCTIS